LTHSSILIRQNNKDILKKGTLWSEILLTETYSCLQSFFSFFSVFPTVSVRTSRRPARESTHSTMYLSEKSKSWRNPSLMVRLALL